MRSLRWLVLFFLVALSGAACSSSSSTTDYQSAVVDGMRTSFINGLATPAAGTSDAYGAVWARTIVGISF